MFTWTVTVASYIYIEIDDSINSVNYSLLAGDSDSSFEIDTLHMYKAFHANVM